MVDRIAREASRPLLPGGSRLIATHDDSGRLGAEFVYVFRPPASLRATADSQTLALGPMPMEKLEELSATVASFDPAMAEHMRNLLASWRAEQAGMGGRA